MTLRIRPIALEDCAVISQAFSAQGWQKPVAQYERYLSFQRSGLRDILIADLDGEFAGYLTINWKSDYPPFAAEGIPEIVDFNVLKKFQRRGFGTQLMDEAENRMKNVSTYAGIGFGLYRDYGPAQILYVKRGYLPDGKGLVYDYRFPDFGEQVTVDDGLALYLRKAL